MTAARLLDRELLQQAFDLLAAKLTRGGVVGELHVFDGAAMVLAFDARVSTRDAWPVLEAAREVADELGLPRSWLNNQASSCVSGRAGRGTPVYDHPNLRVMATSAQHLLAMKVRAARAVRDTDDLRLLLRALDLHTLQEVAEVVGRYFPDEPLSDRSRQLLEDLLAEW